MDCFNFLREVSDESIDLIVVDPPYNKKMEFMNDNLPKEEFETFTSNWVDALVPKLKPTGSMYCFMGWDYFDFVKGLLQKHLILRRELIWWYEQGGQMHGAKNFVAEHDKILYLVKSKSFTFNKLRRPASERTLKTWKPSRIDNKGFIRWEDLSPKMRKYYKTKKTYIDRRQWKPGRGKVIGSVIPVSKVNPWSNEWVDHPTQKPEARVEILIKMSSNEDDIVLDPFIGSGTTMVVSKRLRRRYIGSEINNGFYDAAQKRLDNEIVSVRMDKFFTKTTIDDYARD